MTPDRLTVVMTTVGTTETSEAQAPAKSLFAWTKDAQAVKEVRERRCGAAAARARAAATSFGGCF